MPGIGLDLKITGVQKVVSLLQAMDTRISPPGLGVYMSQVAHPHFTRRVEQRFKRQGDDAAGGRWVPLSEATNAWREMLGFPPVRPINVRTGHLRDSIVNGRAEIGYDGLGATLKFPGLEDRADLFHRMNQASGRYKGPARPVVAYDGTDVVSVLTSLTRYVETGSTRR